MARQTGVARRPEDQSAPTKTFVGVFLGLCVLLALTILFASLDLGPMNAPIAIGIGAAKALLIALFFMHLRVSPPLLRLIAGAVLLWLGIFFVMTLSDYLARLHFELPLF